MTWDELPDGQNIEALDNIRLYSIKPIAIDEGEGIYISDEQIKNCSEIIANKLDIGTWKKDYGYLEFIHTDEDGTTFSQFLDFGSFETSPIIDEKLFKIKKD